MLIFVDLCHRIIITSFVQSTLWNPPKLQVLHLKKWPNTWRPIRLALLQVCDPYLSGECDNYRAWSNILVSFILQYFHDFRCYLGGSESSHGSKFRQAAGDLARKLYPEEVQVECLNVTQLRESDWSLRDVVDWLLRSHIHMITCHFHMGLESFGWPVLDIYEELKRLEYHPGFPCGKKLQCPIIKQDKFEYLMHLKPDNVLPTFSIPLSKEYKVEHIRGIFER